MPSRHTMLSHDEARQFYDRFGSKQDWQHFYESPAVVDLVSHLSLGAAHSIVEFGCGTGWLAESLLAQYVPADATYLGIDVSTTMVDLAQHRVAPFRDRAEVRLTRGETTLDVPSDSTDRFISLYVLDLLTEEDIHSVVAEAHRVLKPGGLLGLVSLTHGCTLGSRIVEKVWAWAHHARPALVGGCRPISLLPFVQRGWVVRHERSVVSFGVPSEILVAQKAE
jgi:ubiquinone/menaquinone biosynthesis C-methylase UbiE